MDPARQLAQLGGGLGELVAEPVQEGTRGLRLAAHPGAGHADVEGQRDEPLLGAVVEVALDLPARRVARLHDPGQRGAQLGRARLLDLAAAQRLLGRAALGHVEEGAVQPQPVAGAGHELPAVEHPAHGPVGPHDPVLDGETAPLRARLGDRPLDGLAVARVHDAQDRAPLAGEEVGGRVAGDPLDLVADQLEREACMPGRAVDRARHVDHQRAQDVVVGPLLGRPQSGADAGEQLEPAEGPAQVVVGAGFQHVVAGAAAARAGDGEHPRPVQAGVSAQRATDPRGIDAGGLAVDDDEVYRLGADRRERGVHAAGGERRVPGRAQPRLHLGLDQPGDQHAGRSPPDVAGPGHVPIIARSRKVV